VSHKDHDGHFDFKEFKSLMKKIEWLERKT